MYIGTRLRILWYTRPSIKPYLGFLFMMGGLLAMMGFLYSSGKMDDASWTIFRVVGGGLVLCVLLPYFGGYLSVLRALRRANKAARLYELYEDFEEAQVIAKGYARLGQKWFFGRGGRNVVAYDIAARMKYKGIGLQQAANPGINTTIRDRFFNSACATPGISYSIGSSTVMMLSGVPFSSSWIAA